ncbi:MAG TPA: hypothetical protein VMU68_12895 [Acidimicrobiales bacterium]|nr:hypothetical protein [Acidimicrobiales bacterium]
MTMPRAPRWSFDVSQADWVKDGLDDLTTGTVSSIVPAGFDAYARILHPVETPLNGDRLVRWEEVADWGGQVLTAQSQWLAIAMPEVKPDQPRPWRSQGPQQGSLFANDARSLAAIAGRFTDTPHHCWCCIWEGFGWWSRSWLVAPGQLAPPPPPTPIPIEAKDWLKVHTRYRDYFLYEESLDTPSSFVAAIEVLEGHSPNLWWPSDHVWCVGTEIDFDSTYVGGSKLFIDAILQSEELEAFEVGPRNSTSADLPEWIVRVVGRTVDELLSTGRAGVVTSIGRIHFELERPGRLHRGLFRYEIDSDGDRGGSGQSPLSKGSDVDLRRQLEFHVGYGLRSVAN